MIPFIDSHETLCAVAIVSLSLVWLGTAIVLGEVVKAVWRR